MKKAVAALSLISLAVALGRFFVPGHALSLPGSYEALAHLWVGGLVGAALAGRKACWWFAGALGAVELVAFAMKTLGGGH